ncbi:hypothetical protein PR001_g5051 [Phytophthora rubi]|uniref:Uncharacterized protein n=1 Tax=Phytophthora rubi TaxID=129364 RepID=A0A6A3NVR2_9STRA|nr:hypothetical protein PR001_g5051 [Phytophthora rubi]
MRSGLLWALQSANITVNTQINRHAWVGWVFVYLTELVFFTAYRLSSLSDLVESSPSPDQDSTANRVYGALLGIVQDFVVVSFLVVVLSGFDATINRLSCCNDTAPNGCLDCFTRGIPFLSRMKLVLKRLLRFSVIYVACLLTVALFSLDVVTVRTYHRRYEFGWDSSGEELVVSRSEENRIATHVLAVVLVAQAAIAAVTMVWFDLTRVHVGRCAWAPWLVPGSNWAPEPCLVVATASAAHRAVPAPAVSVSATDSAQVLVASEVPVVSGKSVGLEALDNSVDSEARIR